MNVKLFHLSLEFYRHFRHFSVPEAILVSRNRQMNVKLFHLSLEGPSTKEQKYCDNNREMTKTKVDIALLLIQGELVSICSQMNCVTV